MQCEAAAHQVALAQSRRGRSLALSLLLLLGAALGLALAIAGLVLVLGGCAGAIGVAAQLAGRLQRLHLLARQEAPPRAADAPRRVVVARLVQVGLQDTQQPCVMSLLLRLACIQCWPWDTHDSI